MQPRLLIALLLLSLVIRLGWGLSRNSGDDSLRTLPDQLEYLQLGRSLYAGDGLVMHDDRLDVDVRAFRTPGYPMLLALCGGSIRAVRIVQAMLDTSTVLAVYLLARRWLPQGVALAAGAVVAVNPYLVYFSALILSETLFIALLAWGMALLTRPRTWPWLGMLLLGLSLLVRPGALLLPVVLAAASAWGNPRHVVARGLVSLAICWLVLLPWAWRNHHLLGRWVWTTTNGGFTLYDGFNPSATGASDQAFVGEMRDRLRSIESEVERSDYLAGLARDYIQEHPLRTLTLAGAKIARTWSPFPLSRDAGHSPIVLLVAISYTVPFFALVLIGLGRSGLSQPAKVMLLLPAIYFTVAHALSIGSLRYRVPADVPMAVIAASAIRRGIRNAEH